MVNLKRLFLLLLAGFILPLSGVRAEQTVFTDYAAGMKAAREQKRAVFLEFMSTGCSHCADFKAKVLETPAFKKFAGEKLVLVILDFHPAEPYPAEIVTERDRLAQLHKVEFTPTIVILAPDGKVLKRVAGYSGDPAEKVVARLASLVK